MSFPELRWSIASEYRQGKPSTLESSFKARKVLKVIHPGFDLLQPPKIDSKQKLKTQLGQKIGENKYKGTNVKIMQRGYITCPKVIL